MKNLEEQLLCELSRCNTDFIVSEVMHDFDMIEELWTFVFNGSSPIQWRAAWVVEKIAIKFPEILDDKMKEIIKFLPNSPNDGTRRLLVKFLVIGRIPPKFHGKVYDICYNWFFSKDSSIAVKAHGLEVMFKIAKENRELLNDILLILETITEEEVPALIAKRRNISKSVLRLMKNQQKI